MKWTSLMFTMTALGVILFNAWLHGERRYKEGVSDATAAFVQADQEGAEDVLDTARETMERIGVDFDPDELLTGTGGLRD